MCFMSLIEKYYSAGGSDSLPGQRYLWQTIPLWLDAQLKYFQYSRGRSQGVRGPSPPPIVDWVEFFYGKNWLCWNVWPALFSKVTLFSLSEVRSVEFCGPQISQIYSLDPAAGRANFEGDDEKKSWTFLHPRSFCAPNVKYNINIYITWFDSDDYNQNALSYIVCNKTLWT